MIRIVGPDLNELRSQSSKIAAAIHDIPGVADLRVEQQVDVPQIEVLLKPLEAARFGFSIAALNGDIQTLLEGRTVGQVYEGDRIFDVVVRAEPSLRSDPTQLGNLLIDSPSQGKLPLRAVANIEMVDVPNVINREKGSRRILVTCNAEGRDVAGVMKDIQARLGQRPNVCHQVTTSNSGRVPGPPSCPAAIDPLTSPAARCLYSAVFRFS